MSEKRASLDDREEILRCIATGEYHGLAAERAHLGAADVESIAMGGKPGQRDVVSGRCQGIAQAGTVDIELQSVLPAGSIEACNLGLGIDGTVLGGKRDIYHSGLGAVVAAAVALEGLHEMVELGNGKLAVVGRQGNHLVSRGLDGRCLVHVDMARIDGDDRLVGAHHPVDYRGIGLGATHQEVDFGIGCSACHPYFLLCPFAVDVVAVGGRWLIVGVGQMFQHLRVGPVVIVAIK